MEEWSWHISSYSSLLLGLCWSWWLNGHELVRASKRVEDEWGRSVASPKPLLYVSSSRRFMTCIWRYFCSWTLSTFFSNVIIHIMICKLSCNSQAGGCKLHNLTPPPPQGWDHILGDQIKLLYMAIGPTTSEMYAMLLWRANQVNIRRGSNRHSGRPRDNKGQSNPCTE